MAKAKTKKKAAGKPPAGDKPKRGKFQDFPIDMTQFDPLLQPRKGDGSTPIGGIHRYHVDDLRAAIRRKEELPRVRIWCVAGKGNFVTDGHHTTVAYREEGKKTVPAEVFEGTWLEAVADASGANDEHKALKRTQDDKRQAVLNLLATLREEGVSWTNKRIAQTCHVSDDLVKTMLLRLPPAPETPKVGNDGRQYGPAAGKRKAGGKRAAPAPATPEPKPEPVAEVKPEPLPVVTPAPAPIPAPVAATPAESPRAFSIAEFNAKYGAMEREIDAVGALYGRVHGPRPDGLRKHLREWKADLLRWLDELKAADQRDKVRGK